MEVTSFRSPLLDGDETVTSNPDPGPIVRLQPTGFQAGRWQVTGFRSLRKSESAIPDTSRQLVADTICMPPHPAPVLTLLSSAIEGATARRRPGLTRVCWRRGEAPLLHHAIRWRAFQDYGGLQAGTAGVQVGRAEA